MQIRRTQFDAIGTRWEIQLPSSISTSAWSALQSQIEECIDTFDKTYSRFRDDSLVSQMARHAGNYELPEDALPLLQLYEKLYKATDSRMTPLIGQVIADAGYDATYSLQTKILQRPPAWEEVLDYNDRSLTVTRPALLDFGAAGKGYLVDLVAELLEAAGQKTYLINAGGDIRHRTTTNDSLQVGLENPRDVSEALGIVELRNASLCASAGSKRSWGNFTHIIDPQSLRSPRDILATWVLADDTLTADGLATAVFFAEPTRLLQDFNFAYAILDSDMGLTCSRDFPAILFQESYATH